MDYEYYSVFIGYVVIRVEVVPLRIVFSGPL
jgi:hypothetical protein